jgi:hypothetical protein
MEQRSLRLGDIVDDYCPRERRVTNHAIVAVVGDSIRQTRCSTCDTEHEYKEAKVPKKRGKGDSDVADLSGGVLVTSKPAANGATSDNGFENGTPEAALRRPSRTNRRTRSRRPRRPLVKTRRTGIRTRRRHAARCLAGASAVDQGEPAED